MSSQIAKVLPRLDVRFEQRGELTTHIDCLVLVGVLHRRRCSRVPIAGHVLNEYLSHHAIRLRLRIGTLPVHIPPEPVDSVGRQLHRAVAHFALAKLSNVPFIEREIGDVSDSRSIAECADLEDVVSALECDDIGKSLGVELRRHADAHDAQGRHLARIGGTEGAHDDVARVDPVHLCAADLERGCEKGPRRVLRLVRLPSREE